MPEEGLGGKVIGLAQPPADPEAHAEANERARLVRESIAALEHDLRAALVLRDVNGMSYEEISRVVRAPLGTVKSRIARARAHVQERLLLYPELFEMRGREASDEA
jgi:RNA polymerase sigma-70 factor (ECF subfamily)